jgi:septum formation protein
MLFELSGDFHEVLTGVTIGNKNKHFSFTDTTLVFMDEMSYEEIDYYIDYYRPYDKAGSYGIQDWIGIAKILKIEGSYTNVMGLPTQKLYNYLKSNNLINLP